MRPDRRKAKGKAKGGTAAALPVPAGSLQRVADVRIGAQHGVRAVVLLAVVAAEAHRDRDVVAAAGVAVLHRLVQHVQAGALEQLRHARGQAGIGLAHRGDLELAGKPEALALLLRLAEVDLVHHFAPGAAAGAAASAFLLPWNHSRIESHRREKKPPCGASFSAISGTLWIGWPSSVTRSVPTCWPFLNGAIRVAGMSMVALSWSYWPVFTVTSTFSATPIGSWFASPFHR